MSPRLFGLGGVISSAAIGFCSLFTVMYFIASFEYQVAFPFKTKSSMPTGNERFAFLGRGFVYIFGQTSRLIKREKAFNCFRLLSVAQKRR